MPDIFRDFVTMAGLILEVCVLLPVAAFAAFLVLMTIKLAFDLFS